MFTLLHSICVYFLVHWLTQHWGKPLVYWLLGYFTASVLATGLVLILVWLSGRTPRVVTQPTAGKVAKEACATSAAIGG